jgi:hypothetical protein
LGLKAPGGWTNYGDAAQTPLAVIANIDSLYYITGFVKENFKKAGKAG